MAEAKIGTQSQNKVEKYPLLGEETTDLEKISPDSSSIVRKAITEAEEIIKREFTFRNPNKKDRKLKPNSTENVCSDDEKTGSTMSDLTEQASLTKDVKDVTGGGKPQDTDDQSSSDYIRHILQSGNSSVLLSSGSSVSSLLGAFVLPEESADSSNHSYDDLKQLLGEARSQVVNERQNRRKQEGYVRKLAKEVNKNRKETEIKKQQVVRLAQTILRLEDKLNAFRSELETLAAQHGKMKSAHLKEMEEAQHQYRRVCRQHDGDVETLKKNHLKDKNAVQNQLKLATAQEDALKKSYSLEIQQLNHEIQELEKTRKKLISRLCEAKRQTTDSKSSSRWIVTVLLVFIVMSGMVSLDFIIERKLRSTNGENHDVSTHCPQLVPCVDSEEKRVSYLDDLCSPVRPGTLFKMNDTDTEKYDAPWWVPSRFKRPVFSWICNPRLRSRITWTPNKRRGRGKLTWARLVDDSVTGHTISEKPVWTRQLVVTAEFRTDHMKLVHQTGNIEHIGTSH